MTETATKTLTSPTGSLIVAACGLQAVYVGIRGVDFDERGVNPDFDNVTAAANPTPVHASDGSLLFVDDGGEFWTWDEIETGVRQEGDHHVVAEINRSARASMN